MKQPLHIIYISGLGDRYDEFRSRRASFWSTTQTRVTHIPMKWRSDESAASKLQRLQGIINSAPGRKTVLVGESAGGSVAIAALGNITGVDAIITVAGKNLRADRVSPHIYRTNPAFSSMMKLADQSALSLKESVPITTYRFFLDAVVRPVDMEVPGSNMKRLPSAGHFFGIATTLLFLWPIIVRRARML